MIISTAGLDQGHPSWESHRPWSLWDMLNRSAWEFFVLRDLLTHLKQEIERAEKQTPAQNMGANNLLLGSALSRIGTEGEFYLPDELKEKITKLLPLIKASCSAIGLIKIGTEIDRITNRVSWEFVETRKTAWKIENITERIEDELKEASFLHVSSEKALYYDSPDLFGEVVGRKFPRAAEDISRAGTCYSVGQNTACVFHLMRVMEHCVQRLGKKLKISINPSRETWHQIMLHVGKAVDVLPGGAKASSHATKKKQKYALAAARLDNVRIAWRNEVMHPKSTYDTAEALEVLTSVKSFTATLVDLV